MKGARVARAVLVAVSFPAMTPPSKPLETAAASTALPRSPAPSQMGDLVIVAAITFLTLFVFGGSARHEFVDLDHHFYAGNPHVQQGLTLENIRWAFSTVVASNWHPVTMLGHMAVHQFFGASSAAHHLVNVFLHLANAMLVFVLFRRMTSAAWRSGVVALLFSLHPFRVESVVWVAELKDVLSGFWALLALLSYTRYAARPSPWRYAPVMAFYALGLMSKASIVSLPALALILDFWPLGRWQAGEKQWRSFAMLVLDKLPLVLLSVAMSVMTFVTFSDGTLKSTHVLSKSYGVVMALRAYLAYVAHTFYPVGLVPHYPYVAIDGLFVHTIVPLLALGGITAIAIVRWRREPYLIAGWSWFVIGIFPVSGIVPFASHFRADRYTYLPSIGLFAALVWCAAGLTERRPAMRRVAWIAAMGSILACAVLSFINVHYWRDNYALFSRAVQIVPDSSLMHSGLASAYLQRNQFGPAEEELRTALHLNPSSIHNEKRLAGLLLLTDRPKESAEMYRRIVDKEPGVAQNYLLLALALEKTGDVTGAQRWAEQAQQLDPGNRDIAEAVRRLAS